MTEDYLKAVSGLTQDEIDAIWAHVRATDGPLSERQIVEHLNRWYKEGSAGRDSGMANAHPGNSVAHFMSSLGWLKRDLQLALCRADPAYRAQQISFGMFKAEQV